ncbi:alpha/beta fold hydrolase [Shewanella surugensis]|uniref:Alpha/beta hydrolase n=1 Tax=Shewanella surugensis TaxID=212020 RepID=A0ABT0LAT2_9GAMM|nr:alpha/beta hydrolase [Shewanella surugensis]MCL1124467.1 alpha/beta hydrolase [Shewanella surugensis]
MMTLNVLFIPGLGGDPLMWEGVANDMLLKVQLHYAAVLKGEGVADLARTILMDAPDRFVVIGFSLGGWVAMKLARIAKERKGIGIRTDKYDRRYYVKSNDSSNEGITKANL